jgi:hypothetical protein
VSLLWLMPLVRVAWADGWVTHAERNYILATARLHGVEENTLASRQLEAWLKWPSSEEFFQGTWRVIQAKDRFTSPLAICCSLSGHD